jgi:hypothetical protein
MPESKAVSGSIRFETKSGSYVVDIADIRVVIGFERHFNTSAQVIQMSPRVEYIAYMAWKAAQLQGVAVPDDFEGFIDELVDIEQVEGDEPRDANPTDGGQ